MTLSLQQVSLKRAKVVPRKDSVSEYKFKAEAVP